MQDKGIWEKSHIRYSGPAVRAAFSLVLNMGFGMGIEQLFQKKLGVRLEKILQTRMTGWFAGF